MEIEVVLVLLHEPLQTGEKRLQIVYFYKAVNLEKHFFQIKRGRQMCVYQTRIHPVLVKRQNFIRIGVESKRYWAHLSNIFVAKLLNGSVSTPHEKIICGTFLQLDSTGPREVCVFSYISLGLLKLVYWLLDYCNENPSIYCPRCRKFSLNHPFQPVFSCSFGGRGIGLFVWMHSSLDRTMPCWALNVFLALKWNLPVKKSNQSRYWLKC